MSLVPVTQHAFGGKPAAVAALAGTLVQPIGQAALSPTGAHPLHLPPAVVQMHGDPFGVKITRADLARLAAEHPEFVTVQPGDTLEGLADHFYGSAHTAYWWTLYQANKTKIGHNPNLIYAGERLEVPAEHDAKPAPKAAQTLVTGVQAHTSSDFQTPAQAAIGSWSIFSQPNGQGLAVGFAHALLERINAPITPGTARFVYDWEVSEDEGLGGGENNPLNGGDFAGLATSGQQFGGGADNYSSLSDTLAGMAGILQNNPWYGYDAVVSALRQDNPEAALRALCNSAWSGSRYGGGADFSNAPLPDVAPVSIS